MKSCLAKLTIFWGSFLIFGVQPMVGRTLLPFFGGTSAVWIVCLCSFQILLLGGYFYAHRLSEAKSRKTLFIHLGLLVLSAIWAFAIASIRGNLGGLVAGLPPAFAVMLFLVIIIGLPYLALSSNSSLVQALASQGEKDVYGLYAISNVGSLVGLFAYPFILEPFVGVGDQWRIFGAGILVYALLLWRLSLSTSFSNAKRETNITEQQAKTLRSHPLLWLVLPAISCVVLNAVTAHLTLDVIALPLLWCILLALFLLSYVIGFSKIGVKLLPVWDVLTLVSAAVLAITVNKAGADAFHPQLIAGCGLILFGCSALHVRLYISRPGASLLTRYYLFGAIGGAVGGALTSLVAPVVFNEVFEYPIAIILTLVAVSVVRNWSKFARQIALSILSLAIIVTYAHLSQQEDTQHLEKTIFKDRGFYGTVIVDSARAMAGTTEGEMHIFRHGSTLHGTQFIAPGYGLKPTVYFTPNGGGLAFLQHPKYKKGEPMRVGILGMGMGVTCAYGRTNDVYRCWEISPEVMNVAKDPRYFTYASECPAKVETVLGDARIALEVERDKGEPKYDLLQIDAFSGDSLPYHLATREAFQLYFDRLAPGGFLAINLSNWHLDLVPLVKAIAEEFHAGALVYRPTHPNMAIGECASTWGLLIKDIPKDFTMPPGVKYLNLNYIPKFEIPTDEKGSFIGLLCFD